MGKIPAGNKKRLKELNAKLKVLQGELAEANRREGKDAYIDVRVTKNQVNAERIKQEDAADTLLGKFFIELDITAKEETVFIPISIASGKKTAGFMYHIEGTAEGRIATAEVRVRGTSVSQVTLGTLLYAKIPKGKTASFQIRAVIRGRFSKSYTIAITRLNYKLNLAEARYRQYLKEIRSKSV